MICFDEVAEEGRRRVLTSLRGRKFRLTTDAEDLTDAVIFRAWRAYEAGKFTGSVTAFWQWLYQIAARCYIDYVRHERVLSVRYDIEDLGLATGEDGPETQVLAAETAAEQDALLADAVAILRRMGPQHLTAVVGHYRGERDVDLGPGSEAAVKLRRFRAVLALRKRMGAKTPAVVERVSSPEVVTAEKAGDRTMMAYPPTGSQGR